MGSAAGFYASGFGPFELLHLGWLVWIAWGGMLGFCYVGAIAQILFGVVAPTGPPRARLAAPGALWLLVSLVMLNGSTQYLGLKTKTSFTMYSNLRTEGGDWNHLVVPSGIRLASYQDDLVEIIETDHPKLQRYVDAKRDAVFFEFQRITSRADQDLFVTYKRGGEIARFELNDGVANDPELRRRHPFWLEKLLYFRGVPKPSDNQCLH